MNQTQDQTTITSEAGEESKEQPIVAPIKAGNLEAEMQQEDSDGQDEEEEEKKEEEGSAHVEAQPWIARQRPLFSDKHPYV